MGREPATSILSSNRRAAFPYAWPTFNNSFLQKVLVRLIALFTCGSIALLVFLAMLSSIARHRARLCPDRAYGATAVAEYVWAAIPWLMIVACALPAVRLIVAGPG